MFIVYEFEYISTTVQIRHVNTFFSHVFYEKHLTCCCFFLSLSVVFVLCTALFYFFFSLSMDRDLVATVNLARVI